jgi:hypothetical protein
MEQELSLLIVFAAGLLSFLSPCVLPLIPGYIAFVSGLSIDDMTERHSKDKKMASAIPRSVAQSRKPLYQARSLGEYQPHHAVNHILAAIQVPELSAQNQSDGQ